jgi:hypothetical protein
MATANEINLDHDLPPNIPTNSITPTSSSAAERGDSSGLIGTPLQTMAVRRRLTPKGILKLIGVRFMRTVRRGNLPFLILFFRYALLRQSRSELTEKSCVVVFFSALTGVGYVEPPSEGLSVDDPEFKLGQPVFDPKEDSIAIARLRQWEALRELEQEWSKKKRPQDVSSSLVFVTQLTFLRVSGCRKLETTVHVDCRRRERLWQSLETKRMVTVMGPARRHQLM